jgi:hypothetical protein
MKITIEVDCTPAEARAFMGLPDVEPLQDEVMAEIQRRVMQGLSLTDPQQLLRMWAPLGTQSFEALQGLVRAATGTRRSEPKDDDAAPKGKSRS